MSESIEKSRTGDLFNPATQERIRRKTNPGTKWAFLGSAVVVGLLVGGLHYEESFLPHWLSICASDVAWYDCEYSGWLDVLAGAAAFIFFGAFVWIIFKVRRIPPTVTCEQCGGRGWIEDLEPTGGRCPRCAHDRFSYFTLEAAGIPVARVWNLRDTPGRELLANKEANKDLL
jgi:hypothetical protein